MFDRYGVHERWLASRSINGNVIFITNRPISNDEVYLRIPVRVKHDDSVCFCQVDTYTLVRYCLTIEICNIPRPPALVEIRKT